MVETKTHAKTHVSDAKKKVVKELVELMKKKTVMIVSIKGLPAAQFQEIKKQIRSRAKVLVAKRSLVDFALEHAGNTALVELEKHITADSALLFSDEDAFMLSGSLADSKSPAKAKAGQIPDEDIYVEAGGTDLIPGPDISALSAVGLKVKVENGKLAIQAKAVLCKKGEPIDSARVAVLAKLNITPFKIGLEPVAAYSNGKVYANVRVNKQEVMESLVSQYSRALAFAVSLPFVTTQSLPFILGKAALHENALKSLIKSDQTQN